MPKHHVLVFGYNEYTMQIAKNVSDANTDVTVFAMTDASMAEAKEDGFKAELFDLSDDWSEINDNYPIDDVLIFCALEDKANNIFLTISLRAAFEHVRIIALGRDQESANKLMMAGANKVMPIVETTVNLITGIMETPVITKVIHNIVYDDSDLQTIQVTLVEGGPCLGMKLKDLDLDKQFGVIIFAVKDAQADKIRYSFTRRGEEHYLAKDDLLVVMGFQDDIMRFDNAINGVTPSAPKATS